MAITLLVGCESLTSIDVSGLKKLTKIGDGFLYNSKCLTCVDLSSLTEVTSVGDYFINNCESLTSIDVSGLKKVSKIGGSFLKETKLTKKVVRGLGECSDVVKREVEYIFKYKINTFFRLVLGCNKLIILLYLVTALLFCTYQPNTETN